MAQLPSDDLGVGIGIDTINNEEAATRIPGGAEDAIDIKAKMHTGVLKKLDWHLFPLVSLLYFLSVLDRVNIASAKIAGMAVDLNLVGLRYNITAAISFVTYCLGQPLSNVVLKFYRPSRWIPVIMVAWGLIVTLMCLVKTYSQLLVARVFLGFAEAGLLPGMIYYVSLWYPRAEMAKRMAMLTSSAIMAVAFGSILAYGIEKMKGIGGLRGWQWIFCLEGLATVLAALASPFLMYDYPETASFLTEAERHYIIELMKTDSQGVATHFNIQFVLQALKDYKTYLQSVILIGFGIPGIAIVLFAPTIINELGFSTSNAQLLTALPFVSSCVTTILVGIHSDRHQLRGPYVIGGAFVGLVGLIVLYTQTRPGAALAGVILATMGIYPAIPVVLAWATSNAGGDVKRGVAVGTITGFSNIGGICGSFIFFDPPRFHVGLGISMGLLGCSVLMSLFAMWNYNRINKQKEKWCSEQGITDEHKDEFTEKGDDSPLFRYTI